MDRVLLIIDDIQYSRHVEMTLRRVGFELEAINNEFSLNEALLTFNPDYIICRGNTNRLSSLSVGKKLKDLNTKFMGKVILVFPENHKIPQEELIRLRVDLLQFEPISTLRLAVHLFSFSGGDIEFIKDKLLKFAITDNQFRNYEQQLLRGAGLTIDSEIQMVSNIMRLEPPPAPLLIETRAKEPEDLVYIPEETIKKMNEELLGLEQELPLRIDTYNRLIKKVDQDLSVGLNKRQTKQVSGRVRRELIQENKIDPQSEKTLDEERINFTKALFKKS